MAEVFQVNKEYLTHLQLLEDLDKYEETSGHEFMTYETHTFEKVFRRKNKRFDTGDLSMYEGFYRCTRGKKKSEPKDSKKKYCEVELTVRYNATKKAMVIRKWNPEHNHEPSEIKNTRIKWVEKYERKIKRQEINKGKGAKELEQQQAEQQRCLEEEAIQLRKRRKIGDERNEVIIINDEKFSESPICLGDVVRKLVKKEEMDKWEKDQGYIIKMNDLIVITDELEGYLKENVSLVEAMMKYVTTDVQNFLYELLKQNS
ncbi:hypothetical protein KQX54_008107 [Cotesia glomerata]|uniref:ZSWIM3 N-terminal domain-containing protein n=1 Tax=Cotesia glomerata TaxID=32391 RepID=A0AAV7IR78_COTGL|nr:hypothetical protein KQX54_008107 [Cotesia glomerata]